MHNNQEEIDSKMINAFDIFDKIKDNGKQYYLNVPGFQRGFAWNKENIESLFNDFEENNIDYSENIDSLTGYLIGNIVLISDKDGKYDIVDGQQRITVISMILKAMSDRYRSLAVSEIESKNPSSEDKVKRISEYKSLSQKLHQKIFTNNNEPKLSHNPELKYAKTYKNILNNIRIIEEGTSSDNLYSTWQSIKKYIDNLSANQLKYLNIYMSKKVKVIVATTPDENNAYQLFEALNGRGQELMPLDLIKNSLMKIISSENEVTITRFNNSWIPFIENISSIHSKYNDPTTFLRYFVMKEFGVDKSNNSLFKYFKSLHLKSSEIIRLVDDLRRDSKIYAEIVNNNQNNPLTKGNKHSQLFHPGYVLFTLLDSMKYRQAHPLLMMFYNSDEETKNIMIEIVTKTSISMSFTKNPSENTKQIVKFINIYKSSFTEDNFDNDGIRLSEIKADKASKLKARNKLIQQMKIYNNSNEKLLKTVLEESSFNNLKGKSLIKIIEYVINNNFSSDITLEHILPVKFNSLKIGSKVGYLGFDPEVEKNKQLDDKKIDNQRILEKYVHKLGNFTSLLNIENNDTKPIDMKLPNYKASNFRMTQAICNSWETTTGKTNKKFIEDRLKYEKSYEYYMHEYEKNSNNDETFIKYFIRKRTTDLANLISKFTNDKLG